MKMSRINTLFTFVFACVLIGHSSHPLAAAGRPYTASLIAPSGSVSDTASGYSWNSVSDATWYYVWVNDSTGNKIKKWYTASHANCGSGTGTCSISPSIELAPGNGKWWVKTWNNSGYGPWSAALGFEITGSFSYGEVTVDWDDMVREIPAYAYGVNSPANLIPAFSNNQTFMSNLEFITQKKGFIRLHGWGMLGDSPDAFADDAWQESGVWDSTKIEQALRPLVDEGYTVMINIPSGPQGEDDYQDPAAFAQFCADLVRIVNIDHGLGIEYWEIPNERESVFINPGLSVNEMATLINTATEAMKAVDPSIKVGGPATAWINVDYLSQLVNETYPNIDFITAHTYSGDGFNSLQNAYDIAQWATTDLAELRARVNVITGDNYLPIFLTEYNISYQGSEGSPRIQSYEGAVYDAIILTESITAGADASLFWNMAPYSDMSLLDGDTPDENAYLFEIFNQSFHGNLVNSQSQDPTKVTIYAVSNQTDTGAHAFSLVNRTANPQAVNLTSNGWLPSDMTWHLWDADNDFSTRNTSWADLDNGRFVLSPYSVNLFVDQPGRVATTINHRKH